jgi:endonuclease/exonuclease/phosphatase family metal-dependent hydrolase
VTLQLVTWNLNGLDDHLLDERTEAAVFEMLLGGDPESVLAGPPPVPPDVIVLQEVVERTFRAHLAPHLRAAGYAIAPSEPPARGYFEIIAARGGMAAAQSLPFPRTGQGRRLLRVQLASGLTVFTAHLESLAPSRAVRVEQAGRVLDLLRDAGPAVFAGDTNLREAEWDGLDTNSVVDAWEQCGSDPATRATWSRYRYDRVWLAGGPVARAVTRIGARPLPAYGLPPSDHLGLRVVLDLG